MTLASDSPGRRCSSNRSMKLVSSSHGTAPLRLSQVSRIPMDRSQTFRLSVSCRSHHSPNFSPVGCHVHPAGLTCLAFLPDGSTLVVSETNGSRILAFPTDADGSLGAPKRVRRPRRTSATRHLDPRPHDPRPLRDVEGGVWVGCHDTGEFLRVVAGGKVTHRVAIDRGWAIAPALGGPDGRTLYMGAAYADSGYVAVTEEGEPYTPGALTHLWHKAGRHSRCAPDQVDRFRLPDVTLGRKANGTQHGRVRGGYHLTIERSGRDGDRPDALSRR